MRKVDAQMRAIVNWFNTHSRPNAMMGACQNRVKPLTLLRPVQTRWTSHFVASKRLLQLAIPLQTLVISQKDEVLDTVGKDKKMRDQALAILATIRDSHFWQELGVLNRLLELLAVAALTCQTVDLRLDQVLLVLGKLLTQFQKFYQDAITGSTEQDVSAAVIQSLEKRWNVADQDAFITATILNPYVGRRRLCFNSSLEIWKQNGLYHTIARVYQRIFEEDPPIELFEDFNDYKRAENDFSDDALLIVKYHKIAVKQNRSPDLLAVWRNVGFDRPLCRLALRLLQILTSTASNERLFSIWGRIDTKDRSSLHHQGTADTARVRADITQSHQDTSRKRKLGTHGYTGDAALSTQNHILSPESMDVEDFESTDAFNLDWELSARKWFQELFDEETGAEEMDEQDLGDSIKTTLSDLFDAGSTLVLNGLTHLAWVRGEADIEAEISYYEMLSRPWEEVSSDDKISKRRKQQVSREEQVLTQPEVVVDDSSSDNGDRTYVE